MRKGCLRGVVLVVILAAVVVLFGPRLLEAGMNLVLFIGLMLYMRKARKQRSLTWTQTWFTP